MQQVCVQNEAVPPAEKNKGNFDEIQQSSDCEYSKVLVKYFFSSTQWDRGISVTLCTFVTLLPHGMRQK